MKKAILWIAVVAAGLSCASAEDLSVRISGKEKSSELIKVGNVWRKDLAERIKVRLRADQETPTSGMVFKAYFFDENGYLLRSQDGPNSIWTKTKRGIEEVGMPATLDSARASEVFLAIPEDLKGLRTTIVVFGNPSGPIADIYPSGKKIEDFNFPEKASLRPQGSN
jgi:hypothetical protein